MPPWRRQMWRVQPKPRLGALFIQSFVRLLFCFNVKDLEMNFIQSFNTACFQNNSVNIKAKSADRMYMLNSLYRIDFCGIQELSIKVTCGKHHQEIRSMEMNNNFVSTAVIGRFNPSILTPEFLKDKCGMDIGDGKYVTPKDIPVAREILFEEKGISFYVDLDRLQIKENRITDLAGVVGPEYLGKYVTKLEYTPIFACGLNFNFEIQLQEEEKKRFALLLNDEEKLFEICKIDKFELETKKHYNKDATVHNVLWILTFFIEDGLKSSVRINLIKSDNIYELNHNIEVIELEKNKENIKLITERLDQNVRYHENIIENLFREVINASSL